MKQFLNTCSTKSLQRNFQLISLLTPELEAVNQKPSVESIYHVTDLIILYNFSRNQRYCKPMLLSNALRYIVTIVEMCLNMMSIYHVLQDQRYLYQFITTELILGLLTQLIQSMIDDTGEVETVYLLPPHP